MKKKQENMKEKWVSPTVEEMGVENTAEQFISDEKCFHHSGCGCGNKPPHKPGSGKLWN